MGQFPAKASTSQPAVPRSAADLLDQYFAYIQRLTWSILDDRHEADDATQETFLAALQALDQYRGEAAFRTWLYRIAVNVCRARRRKRRRLDWAAWIRGQEEMPDNTTSESAELAALRSEADRELWAAVAALEEKHRLPVILRYLHDLTAPEIAQVLDISEGTVYSRLHHARQKLRRRLGVTGESASQDPEVLP